MLILNCKVRLGGSMLNEVRREGVTVPEIILLRDEHGFDAVVEIKPQLDEQKIDMGAGKVKWTDAVERDRLSLKYGDAKVEKLFGQKHQPLPTSLPDVSVEIPEEEPEAPALPDPVAVVEAARRPTLRARREAEQANELA